MCANGCSSCSSHNSSDLFPQSIVSLSLFCLLSLESCGLDIESGDVKIAPRNLLHRFFALRLREIYTPASRRPFLPYHHPSTSYCACIPERVVVEWRHTVELSEFTWLRCCYTRCELAAERNAESSAVLLLTLAIGL